MTSRRRSAVIAAILVLAFVAPMSVAYAMWSTTATATLNVSVAAPAAPVPTAPQTSCDVRKSDNQYTFKWSPSTSGNPTSYRVHKAAGSTGPFVDQGAATSPYDASIPDNGTTYWRVTAVNAAGPSPSSSTLVITRNKASGPAVFTCAVTTP